ncbi:hypothetical protein Salat_2099900 [Sesamum alatum]|uniref:Uncharacterized protein n=1 Tax=Sesamum alatum TaxID=300844 RepID=A0AAE1Y0I9_9LAMI|nr:hypothetical protein Salat_2099900 [Sesamum alatum]
MVNRVTGFMLKRFPIAYLGAPLYVGNRKQELFQPLIDAMAGRVGDLEKRMLSNVGRLQLIKFVLLAMPIHLVYVLKPPKGVLVHIERMFNKVFFGTRWGRLDMYIGRLGIAYDFRYVKGVWGPTLM